MSKRRQGRGTSAVDSAPRAPDRSLSSEGIVCVLGMHRSGTSVLTRMLNLLGVDLGPEHRLLAPDDYNETGFWEHEGIVALDEDLLAACGGTWQDPPPLPHGWEDAPELEDLREQARGLVEEDFGRADLWGWKDPRTCLTLPFWQRLLPPMRYVVCVRNPLAVAASLERVDFPVERSVDLWVRYTASALIYTSGFPRLLLAYEDVIEDWERELERLAEFLGHTEFARDGAVRAAVSAYVEPELSHHRAGVDEALADPRVDFPAKALYAALQERRLDPPVTRVDLLAIAAHQAQDDLIRLREDSDAGECLSRDYVSLLKHYEDLVSRHEVVAADRKVRAANEQRLNTRLARLEEELEAQGGAQSAEAHAREEVVRSAAEAGRQRESLVREVRALAEAAVPKAAGMLVSGLGDELPHELEGFRAFAFPLRGEEPASGMVAVAELETLRAGGAQFLIMAGPALAWLDDLVVLRQYLDARARVVVREEDCAVFALGEPAREDADAARNQANGDALAAFADALVPPGAHVAVATGDKGAFAELDRLSAAGVQYLLLPAQAPAQRDRYSELRETLASRSRLVARRANLGEVYEMGGLVSRRLGDGIPR